MLSQIEIEDLWSFRHEMFELREGKDSWLPWKARLRQVLDRLDTTLFPLLNPNTHPYHCEIAHFSDEDIFDFLAYKDLPGSREELVSALADVTDSQIEAERIIIRLNRKTVEEWEHKQLLLGCMIVMALSDPLLDKVRMEILTGAWIYEWLCSEFKDAEVKMVASDLIPSAQADEETGTSQNLTTAITIDDDT